VRARKHRVTKKIKREVCFCLSFIYMRKKIRKKHENIKLFSYVFVSTKLIQSHYLGRKCDHETGKKWIKKESNTRKSIKCRSPMAIANIKDIYTHTHIHTFFRACTVTLCGIGLWLRKKTRVLRRDTLLYTRTHEERNDTHCVACRKKVHARPYFWTKNMTQNSRLVLTHRFEHVGVKL